MAAQLTSSRMAPRPEQIGSERRLAPVVVSELALHFGTSATGEAGLRYTGGSTQNHIRSRKAYLHELITNPTRLN